MGVGCWVLIGLVSGVDSASRPESRIDHWRRRKLPGGSRNPLAVRWRHVADQVLEFVQLRKPFVRLVEMFDRGIDARGECLGVLGGHGVGADELDLLVQPLLLGEHQGEVGFGLLAPLLAFAQNLQPLQARAKVALLRVSSARWARLWLSALPLPRSAARASASASLTSPGRFFAVLGFQKLLQRFLDAQQPQVGPHQFIELAQARIGGRIGGGQQVVGAGASRCPGKPGSAGCSARCRSVARERSSASRRLHKFGDLLRLRGALGRIAPSVHPAPEERKVRQRKSKPSA